MSSKSVPSLYNICKDFIAHHLHIVDSLDGFPRDFAVQFFQRAQEFHVFDKNEDDLWPETVLKVVVLYQNAYPGLLLTSLVCCETSYLYQSQSLIQTLLPGLQQLDLSGCTLGNKHFILPWIGKLTLLEDLVMRETALGDLGLLTLANHGGLIKLKTLDLEGNDNLKEPCLKSLLKFPALTHVKLPCCLNGVHSSLVPYGFEECKSETTFPFVETKGLAAPQFMFMTIPIEEEVSKASLFYGDFEKVLKYLVPKKDPVILTRRPIAAHNSQLPCNSRKRRKLNNSPSEVAKDILDIYK